MHNIKKLTIILFIFLLPISSNAEVFVSPITSIDALVNNYVIKPSSYQVIPLPPYIDSSQASYLIKINSANAIYKDITAYIVDQQNLGLYQTGYAFRGIGYQKAVAPFVIEGTISSFGPKYLILDNRYAAIIPKKLSISIEARFPIDINEQNKIKQVFNQLYTNLKKTLIFPDFNIHVEPCGQVNAYSESFGSGDVHYCTEMISQLSKTNNTGAFTAIFLHEVGHSLLGLWGIPGNNNEDIADEFSTYVLMSNGPSGYALLDRSLEFWQNQDSAREAANMLQNGDRHSLSVQRLRNIKENMQNGESFIRRWNHLVYQHETDEALNKVVRSPTYGDDIELAQNILKQRQNSK